MRASRRAAPAVAAAPSVAPSTPRGAAPVRGAATSTAGVCACGGGCARCLSPTGTAATPALEAEADRFAERMTTAAAPAPGASSMADLMRSSSSLLGGLGAGERLPGDLRSRWEARAGTGLDAVRVHRDGRAGALAARHDTDAVASGNHIAIAPEAYEPATAAGQQLLAHELAHVLQQALGYATVQRNGHRRRRRRTPTLDAAGVLTRDDPEMMTLFVQLELALADFVGAARALAGAWTTDAFGRATDETAAADAAAAEMRRDGFTATGIAEFVRHVRAASSAARAIVRATGNRDDASLTERWHRVGDLITAIDARPALRSFYADRAERRERRERREAEAARRDYPRIARELNEYLHEDRRLRILWAMPRALVPEVAEFLTERLGTESERWQELFAYLQEHDTWTYYAVQLDGTFIPDLEQYHGISGLGRFRVRVLHDFELVLAHVVLGEFEEVAAVDDAMVNPVRGTGYDTPWIAYLIDIVLGVVPYLGQALDVRDIIALAINLGQHYTTDDAAGGAGPRHADGWETAGTWFRLALTLIGLVPLVGDALKAVGRIVTRVGRGARVLEAVSIGRIVTQIERNAPQVLELLEDLIAAVGRGWDEVVRHATDGWDEIMAVAIARLRPFDAALADVLTRVRAASSRHLGPAFTRARAQLSDVFLQLRNMGDFWGRAAYETLLAARRRFRTLTADGRMLNALDDFERLDRAIVNALTEGDAAAAARAVEELHAFMRGIDEPAVEAADAAADAERAIDAPARAVEAPMHGPTAGWARHAVSRVRRWVGHFSDRWQRLFGTRIPEDALEIHLDLDDARETYLRWLRASAGREVAIYRSATSGEFVVMQGSGNWVEGGVNWPNDIDRWILIEHYHPELNALVQYASPADLRALVYGHGGVGAITERVSSTIRYYDSVLGRWHFTHFGYDPGAVRPYFVDVELPAGGRIEHSFTSPEELQAHLDALHAGAPTISTPTSTITAPIAIASADDVTESLMEAAAREGVRAPGTSIVLRSALPPFRFYEAATGLSQQQIEAYIRIMNRPFNLPETALFRQLWHEARSPAWLARVRDAVEEAAETGARAQPIARRNFGYARRAFWAAVAENEEATALLAAANIHFVPGGRIGNAPRWRVRNPSTGEWQSWTIDVDHMLELGEQPLTSLLASNLRLCPQRENRVVLNQIHRLTEFVHHERARFPAEWQAGFDELIEALDELAAIEELSATP